MNDVHPYAPASNGQDGPHEADYLEILRAGDGHFDRGVDGWLAERTMTVSIRELRERLTAAAQLDGQRGGNPRLWGHVGAEQWARQRVDQLWRADAQVVPRSGLLATHDLTKQIGEPIEASRFTLIDDASIENLPAMLWLLYRVIGRGGLFMLFGAPGSLKTFLALNLSFSIALGRLFHGRAVEQGAVVYVAAEGAAGLSLRVRVLRRWLNLTSGPAGVYFVTERVVRMSWGFHISSLSSWCALSPCNRTSGSASSRVL